MKFTTIIDKTFFTKLLEKMEYQTGNLEHINGTGTRFAIAFSQSDNFFFLTCAQTLSGVLLAEGGELRQNDYLWCFNLGFLRHTKNK